MCNECWGIYPCPICGTDEITEEDYERELDERLNEADDWYKQRLDEKLPSEQLKMDVKNIPPKATTKWTESLKNLRYLPKKVKNEKSDCLTKAKS